MAYSALIDDKRPTADAGELGGGRRRDVGVADHRQRVGDNGGSGGAGGAAPGVRQMRAGEVEDAVHELARAADQGGIGRIGPILIEEDALPGAAGGGAETDGRAA